MAERVVINTGPIIAIARMDAVELIGKLDLEFIRPEEVEAELRAGSLYDHTVVIPCCD